MKLLRAAIIIQPDSIYASATLEIPILFWIRRKHMWLRRTAPGGWLLVGAGTYVSDSIAEKLEVKLANNPKNLGPKTSRVSVKIPQRSNTSKIMTESLEAFNS